MPVAGAGPAKHSVFRSAGHRIPTDLNTVVLTDNAGNQGGRKDNCHWDRSCRRTVVAVAVRLHGDDGTAHGQALDQSIGAYGSHIGLIDGKMKCTEPGHIELNRLAHADGDSGRRHDQRLSGRLNGIGGGNCAQIQPDTGHSSCGCTSINVIAVCDDIVDALFQQISFHVPYRCIRCAGLTGICIHSLAQFHCTQRHIAAELEAAVCGKLLGIGVHIADDDQICAYTVKRIASDFCDTGRDRDLRQGFAPRKSIIANRGHTVWEFDSGQVAARLKSRFFNPCDALRNGDGGKTHTALEHPFRNGSDTAGKDSGGQICAIVEGLIADALDCIRNNDFRHITIPIVTAAPRKGTGIDRRHILRNGNDAPFSLIADQNSVDNWKISLIFLPRCIGKRVFPNIGQARGNHHIRQVLGKVERIIADAGHCIRNNHAGQASAGAEGTVANACDAVREFHIAQILHIEECVISNAGHAFFDNDRCDLLEVYNVIDSPPRPGIAPWVIGHFTVSGDRLADDKRTVIVKRPGYIAADTVSHHFCAGRDPGRLSCRGRTVGGSFLRFGLLLDGRFYLILREIFRLLLSGHFCLIPRGFFRFFLSM